MELFLPKQTWRAAVFGIPKGTQKFLDKRSWSKV